MYTVDSGLLAPQVQTTVVRRQPIRVLCFYSARNVERFAFLWMSTTRLSWTLFGRTKSWRITATVKFLWYSNVYSIPVPSYFVPQLLWVVSKQWQCIQAKLWLVTNEDLDLMCSKYRTGEITLRCDGRQSDRSREEVCSKRKRDSEASASRQQEEEEVDTVFKDLKEKHHNNFTKVAIVV